MKAAMVVAAAALAASAAFPALAEEKSNMTFFVTSVGSGKGADLGGLEGADAHCQALAEAAGSKGRTWKAYLSTTMPGGDAGVNARDRIGKGPWRNAKGQVVAKNVADLHSSKSKLNKQNSLTEKGEVVNGAGDRPNEHDMLTGSDPQGLYSTAGGDTTCRNWTSGGEGSAIVGHHDLRGLKDTRHMKSWNSAHGSAGCSQESLVKTGGAGRFYCFAAR
ncbi:MAG TPA: hypothetical protein VFV84_04680 [Burkholderiales bacterium]|nr:hypothetical protein [Burkholderiales bacterium]